MRSQGQIYIGSALVVIGVVLAIGAIFHINIWAFCWPLALILLGVWFMVRPRSLHPGTFNAFHPLGGIRRYGSWQVTNEEIWMFVGNVDLDLLHADLPVGETTLRIYGFVGTVDVTLPAGVELSYNSTAFVTDARVNDRNLDGFIMPASFTSDHYAEAEKQLRLETYFFIADVKVRIL